MVVMEEDMEAMEVEDMVVTEEEVKEVKVE